MKTLVVATGNSGKLKEIKEILGDKYQILSQKQAGFDGDVEETGVTFFENALIKAKAVSDALGVDALADDSGLCVEALGGAPGVYSARYACHGDDKANREKLLSVMKDEQNRRAKFVSAVVLYRTDGTYLYAEGETHGNILYEEQGENGFGYDNIFESEDWGMSFGLTTDEQKNAVSHRARALHALLQKL